MKQLIAFAACMLTACATPALTQRTAPLVDYHQHLVSPAFQPFVKLPLRDGAALVRELNEAGIERIRQIGPKHILYGSDTSPPGGSIRAGWEIFRSKVPLTPAEFQTIMQNRLAFVR